MAMRSRDLTLDIDAKRITIETWSSDPATYTVANKLIRTTLDNTVQDLKEVISERSYHEGGDLNPLALTLHYRYGELHNSEPLSQVLEQELRSLDTSRPVRIRVEFDKSKLLRREIKPPLLNINLRTSSGKVLRLSESMHTTVQSLKYTLVDDLHLRNGLSEIKGLEYSGGIDVCDRPASTISELLELDTVPFGDLNFFVTLATDMRIRLVSPAERILRTSFMSVNLDTTIFTVKKYILDQYTGLDPNIDTSDIKVIYFGAILSDDTRIRNVTSPSTESSLTLHFVLNRPEDRGQPNGFWSDLKNGRLFDFYPKEPNPYYTTEAQRSERLRQQFRNNGSGNEPTTREHAQGVFVQEYDANPVWRPSREDNTSTSATRDEAERQEEQVPVSEARRESTVEPTPTVNHGQNGGLRATENLNSLHNDDDSRTTERTEARRYWEDQLRTHRLPEGAERTGASCDLLELNGEEILVDQNDVTEMLYRVVLQTPHGQREVLLSPWQCILNDTNPNLPYLMVTPAGYAKLTQLGVPIHEPEVRIQRPETLNRIPSPQDINRNPVLEAAPAPAIPPFAPALGQAVEHAPQQAPVAEVVINDNPEQPRPNRGEPINGNGIAIQWVWSIGKYFLVFFMFFAGTLYGWRLYVVIAALLLHALYTLDAIDTINRFLARNGVNLRDDLGLNNLPGEDSARAVMKSILEFGQGGRSPATRSARALVVDVLMFFTSMVPWLHDIFLQAGNELAAERNRAADAARAELERLATDDEQVADVDEIPDSGDVATGANVHHEN
ncbi:hypothetical protein BON22_1422 [Cyberlindnera fabianii]|uniref:Ubiquitin-like domain-containing protein n=1 Tax=Cyberlindnera fabianii TaxID=36022 RepID=A0A1V2LBE3_CYBFA|nr:hypothetical protein BON22_1422 [Cyberlindnera fabianii]